MITKQHFPKFWKKEDSQVLQDGKYVMEKFDLRFPGYIKNPYHPFTYCHSLTYSANPQDPKSVMTDKFSGSDSPDRFEENLKLMPDSWSYKTKEIVYKVNSSGYRTHEWKDINWKEAIVILGCSNVFGIGVAEDEMVSTHLERLTGRQVVNLGFPAGSNQLIVNNAATLIEEFGMPYAVVINWSSLSRFRFFTERGYLEVGQWNAPGDLVGTREIEVGDVNVSKLWEQLHLDRHNEMAINYYLGKYANVMFKDRTKFITTSYFPESAHFTRADSSIKIIPTARDRLHPGPENNIEFAEYILGRL